MLGREGMWWKGKTEGVVREGGREVWSRRGRRVG